MIVVEGEHLHGLVARHEIGHAVCDELGIEEKIGKRRAGAGAADERIQLAVDFIERLFGDGAHDEFHFGEGFFRPFDALFGAFGKEGDLPGERKDAQPLDLGEIIEKEGGIFAARIEEGDIEAGAFGGLDLLDKWQHALEPLRLLLRLAHGAAPLPVKFDAGQNIIVGAARRAEARLVKALRDAPKLPFLHDGIPQKRAQNVFFFVGQLFGERGDDRPLFFREADGIAKHPFLVPKPEVAKFPVFQFPAALQTIHTFPPIPIVTRPPPVCKRQNKRAPSLLRELLFFRARFLADDPKKVNFCRRPCRRGRTYRRNTSSPCRTA